MIILIISYDKYYTFYHIPGARSGRCAARGGRGHAAPRLMLCYINIYIYIYSERERCIYRERYI